MRKLISSKTSLLLILIVLITLQSNLVSSESIGLESGHSYYVELDGNMGSLHWVGVVALSNGLATDESRYPITAPMTLSTPTIWKPSFPGTNFVDDHHYYAASFVDVFDLRQVESVDFSDLDAYGMFSEADYPHFYPDYTKFKDSPEKTFTVTETIQLGGQNFTAYKTTLVNNIDLYVLKYNEGSGIYSPLFLTKLEPATAFDGSLCFGEFILPVSNRPYNFYILSDLPQYSYRVWVDGVETTYFSQTGIPHELTFEVTNIFTDAVEEDVNIFVAEDDGQNLFLPYRLSGYITKTYSVGSTDASGMETFIVTPTKYGEIEDYKIHYGVFFGNAITSPGDLNITSSDTLIQQKKTFTQPGLPNNLKVAVNSMNSISDYLYRWADSNTALYWEVEYDRATTTFTTYDDGVPGPISLKTGAVNVIDVDVNLGGTPLAGHHLKIKEKDGYLIMNPYTGSAPLTQKDRTHYQQVPLPAQLIITPTSYNDVSGNVTVEILDAGYNVVGTISLPVDAELEDPSGNYFSSNLLKTISVAMRQILSSMYYSLN